jgi:Fur family transcriptional regulator, zinc uptake regulator
MPGTPLRELVEAVLRASERPLGAYDLADAISLRTGRKCHTNSVYRCLDYLCSHGVVYQIAVNNKFLIVDGQTKPNSFLVCSACNMVTGYFDGPTEKLLRNIAERAGFVPKQVVIECVGLCDACASAVL